MREMQILSVYVLIFTLCFANSILAEPNENDSVRIRKLSSIEEPFFKEIQIRSQTGIGKAEFRARDLLPGKKLVLILYLNGLECFMLDTGRLVLKVEVSSSDGTVRQYISTSSSNGELQLDENSSMKLMVRKNSTEGYFELIVPPTLTRFFRNQVKFSWIDFYR